MVTHGSIGESLLASAKQILNSEPPLTATLGVSRSDDPEDLILRVKRLLKQLDAGSPCCCACSPAAMARRIYH